MTKNTPLDHETRRREALAGLLKEPKWSAVDWLKDLGFSALTLIGSILIVAIALLGIARGFGLV